MKMKTPVFSILLCAVISPVVFLAQPTLVDAIEIFEGSLDDPNNEEIALHWDVANLTDDTLNLMVTRNIIQLVSPFNLPYDEGAPGAYDRFCWGPLCYPYGQFSSFSTAGYLVELHPNETDTTFIADYYPAGIAGVTAFEYCFHPVGDIPAGTCQQVLYCLDADNCALSVGESIINSSPIFPQPVTGLSSFPYQLNGSTRAELTIHNAGGQLIEQKTLRSQQGVVFIDAASYASGVYILSLMIPTGERVTEQFLVR